MKIFGYIPARMASSRLPGKPLKYILGKTMLDHVYQRAKMFNKWHGLFIAGCDKEIRNFCSNKNYPYIETSKKHDRCLDRVVEAAFKTKEKISEADVVVCIQGDEPMFKPKMIKTVIDGLTINKKAKASILVMDIISKDQYLNPNIVKVVNNVNGEILYCSRSPIPFSKRFSKNLGAKRIYGIYAFRYEFLKHFNKLNSSPLEIIESCDQNRICDNGGRMYVAEFKFFPSFSVDTNSDLKLVRKKMPQDILWKKYKNF